MSTAEYRETAPPLLRLGTGADDGPGAPFVATGLSAALPHVGLAYVNPGRVVRNPVGNVEKVGVAPEPKRVGPASQNLEYGFVDEL